jgi:hypothetical protein
MFIADNAQGGSTVNYQTMTDAEREASARTYEENLAREKREKTRKWNEVSGKLVKALSSLGLVIELHSDEYGTGGYVKGYSAGSLSYLSCSWDRYGSRGRVTVSVSAMNHVHHDELYRYGEERVSISFDGDKTTEAMASDIKRRILPHFVEVETRLTKRIADRTYRLNTKAAVLTQLKGFAPDEQELSKGEVRLDLEEGYGDVSYYDETHASIDLYGIALDKVLRIMEIVREK